MSTTDFNIREYLSKRVKMPPRTFRRNMKILEEGEPWKERKEVADLFKFLAMRKNAQVRLRSNLSWHQLKMFVIVTMS